MGADDRYIEFCKSTFPSHLDLRGLKLVVDTANGQAMRLRLSISWNGARGQYRYEAERLQHQ